MPLCIEHFNYLTSDIVEREIGEEEKHNVIREVVLFYLIVTIGTEHMEHILF